MNAAQKNHDPPVPEPRDLIDLNIIFGWVRLCLSFIRKRKWIPITTTVFMLGLAVGALKVLPKTFEASSVLLAKRNEWLSPDRIGALTDGAEEALHRRENVANMVKRTNLLNEWKKRRGMLGSLRDQVTAAVFTPISDKDLEDMLIFMVGEALVVETEGDTIEITVAWRDAELAYQLVATAQESFLEERHVQEVALLAESVGILEGHAAMLEKQIADSMDSFRVLVKEKNQEIRSQEGKRVEEAQKDAQKKSPRALFAPPKPTTPAREVNPLDLGRLSELEVLIQAKREALDRITAESQGRLLQLHTSLAQQRAIYKEAHPAIQDLQQQIAAAQQDSPMASRLRSELSQLQSEASDIRARTGTPAPAEVGGARPARVAHMNTELLKDLEEEAIELSDPDVSFARAKFMYAIQKYQRTTTDIEGARLDLGRAQAAFKHRYRVVTPARVPDKPTKPKPAQVLIGALLGGIALGILLALALELRRGLIYESWQVESSLGMPVVAHINLGSGEPPRLT